MQRPLFQAYIKTYFKEMKKSHIFAKFCHLQFSIQKSFVRTLLCSTQQTRRVNLNHFICLIILPTFYSSPVKYLIEYSSKGGAIFFKLRARIKVDFNVICGNLRHIFDIVAYLIIAFFLICITFLWKVHVLMNYHSNMSFYWIRDVFKV